MRLYNAASCVPMGTTSSSLGYRSKSSFVPNPRTVPSWQGVKLRKTGYGQEQVNIAVNKSKNSDRSPPDIKATSTNSTDVMTTPSVTAEEVESVISERIPALRNLQDYLQKHANILPVASDESGTISTFSTRCSIDRKEHCLHHRDGDPSDDHLMEEAAGEDEDPRKIVKTGEDDFFTLFEEEFPTPPPQATKPPKKKDLHPWSQPRAAPLLETPPTSNETMQTTADNTSKVLFRDSPPKPQYEKNKKTLFEDFRTVRLRKVSSIQSRPTSLKATSSPMKDSSGTDAEQENEADASPEKRPLATSGVNFGDSKHGLWDSTAGPIRYETTKTFATSKKTISTVSPSSAASPVVRSFGSPFDLPRSPRDLIGEGGKGVNMNPNPQSTGAVTMMQKHPCRSPGAAIEIKSRVVSDDDMNQLGRVDDGDSSKVDLSEIRSNTGGQKVRTKGSLSKTEEESSDFLPQSCLPSNPRDSLLDAIKSRSTTRPPSDIPKNVVIKKNIPLTEIASLFPQKAASQGVHGASNNASLFKYKDMLKKGVPAGAVRNSMIRDGVDPGRLDLDLSSKSPTSKMMSHPLRRQTGRRDNFRRTRLHWQTHSGVRSNTIWGMVERDPDVAMLTVDEREFQALFQQEETPYGSERRLVQPTLNQGSKVRVIDSKRANNGGIILARVKLSHEKIANAVDSFDYQAMTSEQIRGVLPFIATSEEGDALLNEFRNGVAFSSLCECEKFMITMLNVPYAKKKLEAMLFMQNFTSNLEEIRQESEMLVEACKQVMASSRLRKVLGIVLELGNRLNTAGGSNRERASAITLESLLKLNTAKAFDKKTTFLQYVVKIVRENNGTLVHFKDEISTVFKAEKVDVSALGVECHRLTHVLEDVRKFVLHLSGEYPSSVVENGQVFLNAPFDLSKDVAIQNKSMVGRFCLNGCMRLNAVVNEVAKAKEKQLELLDYFGEAEAMEKSKAESSTLTVIGQFARDFEEAVDSVIRKEKQKRWSHYPLSVDEGIAWSPKGCSDDYFQGYHHQRNDGTRASRAPSVQGVSTTVLAPKGYIRPTLDLQSSKERQPWQRTRG